MAYDIRTRPGAWVREQTNRRESRIVVGLLAGVALLGLYTGLLAAHRVSTLLALAFLGFVLVIRRPADRYIDRHIRLRDGTLAEEAVGTTLEELRGEGWIVMHGVELAGDGTVDHLVSGPGGVFLLDTKAKWYQPRHLSRLKRQAKRLRYDELGVWVTPVICIQRRYGSPSSSHGVWVVPRRELLDWLRGQHNKTLDFERLARFADKL